MGRYGQHHALVGGYELLSEFADERLDGGQDMPDANWIDRLTPTTNEQTTHDGQTNCRHLVGDAQFEGVESRPKFTTVNSGKYQVSFKLKVISGTIGIHVRNGDDSGWHTLSTTETPATWTQYNYEYTEGAAAGGALSFIAFQAQNAGASEFYVDEVSIPQLYTPDYSGRANHGTVNGATATPWGYSFITDDYIITDPIPIKGKEDRTILGRMKCGKTDFSTEGYFFSLGTAGAQVHYGFAARGNPATWQLTQGTAWFDTGIAVSTVDFQEIVVQHSSFSDKSWAYIDGVFAATGTHTALNTGGGSDSALNLGRYLGDSAFFDGTIRDVEALNQILTQREIREQMHRSRYSGGLMNL